MATFKPGAFFGELSIIDGAPRSAGCRAEVSSRLLSLDKTSFYELKRRHPAVAFKIMRRMLLDAKSRMLNTSAFLSELVQWGEEARKRAITDELTGLYNRRHLDETLENAVGAARLNGAPLSLVMVDLDHFGAINEQYTQAVGDVVIKEVVGVFRRSLRAGDIAARYGGDEFNLVLQGTDAPTAVEVCSTICNRVAALDVLRSKGGTIDRVTTSQGVATFPENADRAATLREAADAALYAAKEAGRNRVVHASAETGEGA